MKNTSKTNQFKTSHIIIVILVIILIVPVLLSLPAFSPWLDFSKSGEIGSLIGGVTAPFINGLAAILVFLAFKAQIKANEQLSIANMNQIEANESLKNQEQINIILKQLEFIQGETFQLPKTIEFVINRKELYFENQQNADANRLLVELLYFIAEIDLTISEIEKYQGEKTFLYKKLYYLYKIKFSSGFDDFKTNFNIQKDLSQNFNKDLIDVFFSIKKFNNYFSIPNKYDA